MRSGLFLSPATHTPPPSMAQERAWNCVLHKQMASNPALVIKNRAEPTPPRALPTSLHRPLGVSKKVVDAPGVCHPPYTPVSACAVPQRPHTASHSGPGGNPAHLSQLPCHPPLESLPHLPREFRAHPRSQHMSPNTVTIKLPPAAYLPLRKCSPL